MTSSADHIPEDIADRTSNGAGEYIAPAPRVSVQAFCVTQETAAAVKSAGEDRRLGKTHLTTKMGGTTAAIEAYSAMPTPNVIILESEAGINIDRKSTRLNSS